MALSPNSNELLGKVCPVSGSGTLAEPFLVELGKFLDNDGSFPTGWRGLAWSLLRSNGRDTDDFYGRASRDCTHRRSPTWEVYQKFIQMNGDVIDIEKFWHILYHSMKRRDAALELEQWYQSNRLFIEKPQLQPCDQPSMVELPNSLSLATAPPEEGSDITSVVPDVNANSQHREVDTLRVTANTIIINTLPGQQVVTNTPPSTETTSLTSTSSSSTSSLPGDQEFADPPREIVIHNGTSAVAPNRPDGDSARTLGIVLITYADHDKPKAVDVALHLRMHGYLPLLDNTEEIPERERKRECKRIFRRACAVVVIYSNFYRTEIFSSAKVRNTRHIYNLLKEEYDSGSSNQRCVLYPMYQIQKGFKLPRIFNHLPQHDRARQVHRCLFRPVR